MWQIYGGGGSASHTWDTPRVTVIPSAVEEPKATVYRGGLHKGRHVVTGVGWWLNGERPWILRLRCAELIVSVAEGLKTTVWSGSCVRYAAAFARSNGSTSSP